MDGVRRIPLCPERRRGEIGRRKGLKIPATQVGAGSSPAAGTKPSRFTDSFRSSSIKLERGSAKGPV